MPSELTTIISGFEMASVKVMRSHDYCHFEVCLSSSSANTLELVDELRKQAARLADKAVKQYQQSKRAAMRLESKQSDLSAQFDYQDDWQDDDQDS